MTVPEAVEFVKRLEVSAGMKVLGLAIEPCVDPTTGCLEIRTSIQVPHRDTGKFGPVAGCLRLPLVVVETVDAVRLYKQVRLTLMDLLTHELDESIRLDGKLLRDPHS